MRVSALSRGRRNEKWPQEQMLKNNYVPRTRAVGCELRL